MANCILYRAWKWDETARANFSQYANCGRDMFVLYDCTNKPLLSYADVGGPIFNFSMSDYAELPYVHPGEEIKSLMPNPVPTSSDDIWFNPEYAVLMFYLLHPDYDYYYSMEWDCFYNGEPKVFFDENDKKDEDLLGVYLRSPGNEWTWKTLNFSVPDYKKRSAFGAIHRYSKKCLAMLDEEYRKGKYGFYEVIVPTLANMNGLKICDFNWGNGTQWYNPATMCCDERYAIWRNMLKSGNFIDTFFHPVKEVNQLKINN